MDAPFESVFTRSSSLASSSFPAKRAESQGVEAFGLLNLCVGCFWWCGGSQGDDFNLQAHDSSYANFDADSAEPGQSAILVIVSVQAFLASRDFHWHSGSAAAGA